MAAQAKSRNVRPIQGDWMAREPDGWRVDVPCQGGHDFFPFKEYGTSADTYAAARKFQIKAYRQYQKDKEYRRKNGEMPKRQTLNRRNRSGITGCYRSVEPRLSGPPLIVWFAFWNDENGIQQKERFSMTEYETEEECKQRAKAHRRKMRKA